MKLRLLILFLISPCWSLAAPLPVTGSSSYLDSKKNYFLHPFQIGLDLEKTPYSLNLEKNDDEKWTISQETTSHLITLRLKRFRSDREYERSLKGWIKEYQKSGFQLLNQQMGGKRPAHGWLHLQNASGQQLLQYFRYKNKIWVYFNCIGKKEDLAALQKACENLSARITFRAL